MKILRASIEKYLEEEPKARERSNKDRAIVNTLLRDLKYFPIAVQVEKKEITRDLLVRLVQDYNSMDRAWRKVLEERPELRGTDYGDKDALEEDTMLNLGYKEPTP